MRDRENYDLIFDEFNKIIKDKQFTDALKEILKDKIQDPKPQKNSKAFSLRSDKSKKLDANKKTAKQALWEKFNEVIDNMRKDEATGTGSKEAYMLELKAALEAMKSAANAKQKSTFFGKPGITQSKDEKNASAALERINAIGKVDNIRDEIYVQTNGVDRYTPTPESQFTILRNNANKFNPPEINATFIWIGNNWGDLYSLDVYALSNDKTFTPGGNRALTEEKFKIRLGSEFKNIPPNELHEKIISELRSHFAGQNKNLRLIKSSGMEPGLQTGKSNFQTLDSIALDLEKSSHSAMKPEPTMSPKKGNK